MIKLRPVIAAVSALGFYTATDILVWQRIFERHRLLEYADSYHTGWFVSLAGYAVVGLILLWGKWKDCLYYLAALFICAFSGLEDMLYYIFDHKPIPDSLPWLGGNPMIYASTRVGLISSVAFWMAALILLYIALFMLQEQPTKSSGAISSSGPRAKGARIDQ